MQPGRLGGRKVDVVVLLLATVSESQIESGGGREGGKEGAVKQMKKHSPRIPQTGGGHGRGRGRHAGDAREVAVFRGRHFTGMQFFNHG